jgi:hypothetical protein
MNAYQTTRAMPQPPRRRRRGRTVIIILVVIVVLLVVLDFAARLVAESVAASEIKKQGFPKKPSVSIGGFPFLTQVASRDISSVTVSSTNVPAGPIKISSIDAHLHGVHINSSFNGATVDTLDGTAKITFGALSKSLSKQAGVGGLLGAAGLHLTSVSNNEVKASINVVVTSGSAVFKVTQAPGDKLDIRMVSSHGLPTELLGSLRNITVPLSGLPLHLKLESVQVTPAGIVGTLGGQDLTFGG